MSTCLTSEGAKPLRVRKNLAFRVDMPPNNASPGAEDLPPALLVIMPYLRRLTLALISTPQTISSAYLRFVSVKSMGAEIVWTGQNDLVKRAGHN